MATVEDAARVDRDPPLVQLNELMKERVTNTEKGESVVYWMRMEDMRSESSLFSLSIPYFILEQAEEK